jgi:hypothetical protein
MMRADLAFEFEELEFENGFWRCGPLSEMKPMKITDIQTS